MLSLEVHLIHQAFYLFFSATSAIVVVILNAEKNAEKLPTVSVVCTRRYSAFQKMIAFSVCMEMEAEAFQKSLHSTPPERHQVYTPFSDTHAHTQAFTVLYVGLLSSSEITSSDIVGRSSRY